MVAIYLVFIGNHRVPAAANRSSYFGSSFSGIIPQLGIDSLG